MSRKIVENAILLTALQGISLGLPFLALPYLAAALGPSGLGSVVFALSAGAIVSAFSEYGFELSASRSASVHRADADKLASLWCAVTGAKFLLATAGCLAVLGLSVVSETVHSHLSLIAIGIIGPVFGNVLLSQWFFQGLEKLRVVSALLIAARLILFAAIFLLVERAADLHMAVFLLSAAPLFAGFAALPYALRCLRGGRPTRPPLSTVMNQLRDGRHVFASVAAVTLYTSANTFLLGLIVSPAALGYYHLAEKGMRAVQALYAPVSNAIFPHVAQLASVDASALVRFNARLLGWMLLAGVAAGGVTFFIGPILVAMFFGPGYELTISLLKVFSLVPVFVAVSNVLGVQLMLPLRMDRDYTRILLTAAAFNLAIFAPAVHGFGVLGAAWVTVTVEAGVALLMLTVLWRSGFAPFKRVRLV